MTATETPIGKNKTVTKWGVRLVGVYFFLWAVSTLVDTITNKGPAKGFYGITMYYGSADTDKFDLMAWIGVYILFYIAIQLFRFDPRGRTWALVLLWWPVIFTGVLLLSSVITFFIPSFYTSLPFSFNPRIRVFDYSAKNPLETSLFLMWGFTYFSAPLFFLLRKNTKTLFQKADLTGEPH